MSRFNNPNVTNPNVSSIPNVSSSTEVPDISFASGSGTGVQQLSAEEAQIALGNIMGPTNELLNTIAKLLAGRPIRNEETGEVMNRPLPTQIFRRTDPATGEVIPIDVDIGEGPFDVQGNVAVSNLPVQNLPGSMRPAMNVNIVASEVELGQAAGEIAGAGAGAGPSKRLMNNMAMYLNPYANLNDAQLIEKFRELGLERYAYLIQTDRGRAMRKLDAAAEMNEYTQNILDYNRGKSMFVDEGFQRKAFDVFVKTSKTNPKGVPLEQTYRYLPKSIPEAHVKFDGKLYNLIQGGTKMTMKNYRQIEALALKGGTYADELTGMRDIRQHIEKFEVPMNIIFKSRKV